MAHSKDKGRLCWVVETTCYPTLGIVWSLGILQWTFLGVGQSAGLIDDYASLWLALLPCQLSPVSLSIKLADKEWLTLIKRQFIVSYNYILQGVLACSIFKSFVVFWWAHSAIIIGSTKNQGEFSSILHAKTSNRKIYGIIQLVLQTKNLWKEQLFLRCDSFCMMLLWKNVIGSSTVQIRKCAISWNICTSAFFCSIKNYEGG